MTRVEDPRSAANAGGGGFAKLREERTRMGFTAVPLDAPSHGTVGVLHPWWGLTEPIIDRCRDLARQGYVAVAPDLYCGQTAANVEEAQALRRQRRGTPVWRTIVAVLDQAQTHQPGGQLALIGYSMGGHWALWLASRQREEVPAVLATVVYYATRACDFTASHSAVQVHLAESDPFVTATGEAAMERALRRAGRPYERHQYPGTGHWFAEQDREDAFRPEAARLAWDRTIRFLDAHLRADAP